MPRRYKHSLSHYKLLTADMGKLYPVTGFEALPGDSIRGRTSALIRVSPLANPVMHPVVVRFHWWFCPNRLLGTWGSGSFESFITGGKDGAGDGATAPTDTLDSGGIDEGDPGS